MMEIQHSVVIDRPVEAVFEFVSNAGNDPLWETGVEACVPDQEPSVGQQRDVVMKMFGRRYEGTAEMTEYELERRLTIEIKSGLPFQAQTTYEFEELGERTRLDLSIEAEPTSRLLSLAQPIMRPLMQRQWEGDLATLKELLESQTAADTEPQDKPETVP